MEGNTHVLYKALLLQLKGRFVGPTIPEVGVTLPTLGVHQVNIKVFNAAVLQLLGKQWANIRLGFKTAAG